MKKVYLNWAHVENYVHEILHEIAKTSWRPDYVVGIVRGGLVPCILISQYFDCPMYTLNIRLRDGAADDCESNLWMAEDAFGCGTGKAKNILIVDDINDSGATINWIQHDWQSGTGLFRKREGKNEVWGGNVRIAVLVNNESSKNKIPVSYSGIDINKHTDPQWIYFPWEDFWSR